MIFLDNFDEIYSSMIAGAIPSADGTPASMLLVVQDILDTEDLHVLYHFDPALKRIFYFAAPSRALHSVGKINLPLVAAIPGFPGHRGNAAYVCTQGGTTAAAVYNEGELRLLANSVDAVQDALNENGLPVYDVSQQTGETFESFRGKYRRQGDSFTRRAVNVYALVALVAGISYLGLSAAAGYFERVSKDNLEDRQRSLEKISRDISFASPLHERLARLQSLANTVVRSGGWIDQYEYEAGHESFRLMLPEWVTSDHYAQLGAEVTADAQGDGMVAVVKAGKPASGGATASSGKVKNEGTASPDAPLPAEGAATAKPAQGVIGAARDGAQGASPRAQPDPAMPAQAPFGSPASRPPRPAALGGN